MSRTLTAAVQAAIAAENVPFLILVQLDFGSGYVRVTNCPYAVTWNGYTWLGLGALGSIEAVKESAGLEAAAVALKLAGVPLDGDGDSELIAIALGEHYQGREAKIWAAPLDADHRILSDPVLIFNGRMDTMPIEVSGGTAAIALNVESRLADWDRPRVRRYNDADQQAEYAGDLGLQFVEQMVEKAILWGRA